MKRTKRPDKEEHLASGQTNGQAQAQPIPPTGDPATTPIIPTVPTTIIPTVPTATIPTVPPAITPTVRPPIIPTAPTPLKQKALLVEGLC